MLGKIASFEFRYHLLSPAFIAVFSIYFLLAFGNMTVDQIQIGSSNTINANSPIALTFSTFFFSLFGVFIPTIFLVSGILRDKNFKTEELFFTTRIGEKNYLLGRFIGGFVISALAFASVPLGAFIGSLMPWLDPENMGPNNPLFYVWPYLVIGLVNMLVVGMIMFTVANLSKSLVLTWVSVVGFLVLWLVGNILANNPEYRTLVALLDPLGGNAFGEITRYWTSSEQNSQVVPLEGVLLYNRLIWSGVAIGLFVFNALIFTFRGRNAVGAGSKDAGPTAAPFVPTHIQLPVSSPRLNSRSSRQQFLSRVNFEVKGVVFNVAFWILLAFGILNVVGSAFLLNETYGTPSYPLTQIMATNLVGAFAIIPIIVVIYYASEVVWRERTVRFSDIVDATPAPSWAFMWAKLVALFVVVTGLIAFAVISLILTQIIRGYFAIELDQYVIRSVIDLIIPLTLLSAFALFIQVVSNNRWIGIGVMGVIFIVLAFVFPNIGLTHTLYQFPFVSLTPYSDMNGYGHFVGIQLWQLLYWSAVSLFLFTIAFVMWNRGALAPIWQRLRSLPGAFNAPTAGLAAAALLVAIGSGSWIYYNTVVLNDYTTGPQVERQTAEFEREWRDQLEGLPQPTITDVEYTVDIYNAERRYTASGTNTLVNHTDEAIPVVWVSYGSADVLEQSLEGASAELRSELVNLYAFELETPMQPGETRTLSFAVEVANPGFRNSGNVSSVNFNGTFFNNGEFAPSIGFNRGFLLQDPAVRRRQDLPPIDRAFALEDEEHWDENYIRQDSDYVTFRTLVSTDEGQTVVAPGYLQRDWVEDGRHYFEYVMEDRSLNFFNWMSAEYALLEEEEDGINYQVFYHPAHDWNIERMMQGAQDSLAYMSEHISPYQYRQYRMLEFPAYASFAQSFPNTIAYSEAIGFTADLRDEDNIDYVYYVTAHEAAHQWWAHQIMGPNVQGGSMLVETFAQYSALMVMREEYGDDHMRRFLKYELDSYLSARGNETREELPLYRVENQQHIHYRKGAVIMFALQDYIGEDTVNRALSRLVEEFQYQSDPYPTTLDFLRILREEAGPEHERIIHDFFERIMIFDLSIDTDTAERRELEDGRWETVFTVNARLYEADGEGNETEEPIDYDIDVGLFMRNPDTVNEGTDHILYFERRRINQAETTLSIITDEEPAWVGIDPYNKLIDRNSDDNIIQPPRASDDADDEETGAAEGEEAETASLITE